MKEQGSQSFQIFNNQTYSNVIRLKWWQKITRKSNSLQKDRIVTIFDYDQQLPTNQIHTSKYNYITFLPKNLYQQFTKLPNIYFLIIGIFQTIRSISSTQGIPTIYIPLSVIVLITAIKDLYQDYERSISDNIQNQQTLTQIKINQVQHTIKSKNIKVGMVIKISKNELIPCDGLLVYAPSKFAYVQTKSLDGQTNLKRKMVPIELDNLITTTQTGNIKLPYFKIQYEKPNTNMNKFKGYLNIDHQKLTLSQRNILLRGCKLKNTQFVYLLALYTGHDTKILLSMDIPQDKISSIDKTLSKLIIFIFITVILLSMFLAYMRIRSNHADTSYKNDSLSNFFIGVMTWILNLTNLIPISLIATLEITKLLQGKILMKDKKMRNHQFQSMVNCSNVLQDLGVIQLVASDKTGTLTKNSLSLRMISDGIHIFEENSMQISPYILRMLCICNEAYVTKEGQFQSLSQDQIAILKFCKRKSAILVQRTQTTIKLDIFQRIQSINILHIIEFSSERKKQSVIFQDGDQSIFIVTKGADQQMIKIVEQNQKSDNIFRDVNFFAEKGYRTLVMAHKKLKIQYINNWQRKYKLAKLTGNQQVLKNLQDEIQNNLEALCCTGVQDQLQDQVIQTIQTIIQAKIKFIIISGDKPQTVLAIAKNLHIAEPFIAPTNQFLLQYLEKPLVVFARCTPRQKLQIVRQIPLKTLAIGDGANDVSMITAATIGVGIAGKQGKAAVQSSDFGIPQFKFLKRLLFYYGHESYRKNSQMNFLYTFPQITFGFLSGFTAVYIYEIYLAQLYNVLFTCIPIFIFSLYDQCYNEEDLMKNKLNKYMESQKRIYFSFQSILICLLQAIIQGIFSSYICFNFVIQLYRSPNDLNIIEISSILMLYVVIYANIKVLIMSKTLTLKLFLSVVFGIAIYFTSIEVIVKFAADLNRKQTDLFIPRSGLIIIGCILISFLTSIIAEIMTWKLYIYKTKSNK